MSATVTSADAPTIALDQVGAGPLLILVGAAFHDWSGLAPLAEALALRFTIINYDQRGRGESGDTPPYAVERKIEDLDALIAEAGDRLRSPATSPEPRSL